MKRYYKAVATITDGVKEWDVVIYSRYRSGEEAEDGVKRFVARGYNIVNIRIE